MYKTIFINLLFIIYCITSIFIIGIAMFFPFAIGMKDAPPTWIAWILYPITLVICATQNMVLKYFDKNAKI